MNIPFNKPFLTGKETQYIVEAVNSGKISGDGLFTKRCHRFLEERYGFKKVLLTTSCTDALEMAALLLNLQEGDEVIAPAYTFVSTVNAFVLRGAKIIFADSQYNHPNINADEIEKLITAKTKVIIAVHYAGNACDMNKIMTIANKYNLFVVEDAAQAIDSFYIDDNGVKKPLGSIGHLSAFSFHETKNIISGEGGMLVINDDRFIDRAEVIREKGTNRSKFFRGEVDKYGWVDIGSSFLPSEIIAAFLYAQLENVDKIHDKRKYIWKIYNDAFQELSQKYGVHLPYIPSFSTNNAHMYYLILNNIEQRTKFIDYMKKRNVTAVFHYQSLDKSCFYTYKYPGMKFNLPNSDRYTDSLVRLPLFYDLNDKELKYIINNILSFFIAAG